VRYKNGPRGEKPSGQKLWDVKTYLRGSSDNETKQPPIKGVI